MVLENVLISFFYMFHVVSRACVFLHTSLSTYPPEGSGEWRQSVPHRNRLLVLISRIFYFHPNNHNGVVTHLEPDILECIKVDDAVFNYIGCHIIKIAFTEAWRAREASTLVFRHGVVF